MIHASPDPSLTTKDSGWLSRERTVALVLIVATAVVFYCCYRLILPFIPAVSWALALAVMAHPMYQFFKRWMSSPNIAAGLSVVIVTLVIVLPAVFVTHSLVRETAKYTDRIQEQITSGRWRASLEQHSLLRRLTPWIDRQLGSSGQAKGARQFAESQGSRESRDLDSRPVHAQFKTQAADSNPSDEQVGAEESDLLETVSGGPQQVARSRSSEGSQSSEAVASQAAATVGRAAEAITGGVGPFVSGTIWLTMQLFITLMSLFFFFRDRHHALGVLRSLMPLSNSETDEVFSRVDDTIHATIYGSLVVALVQGLMGGLIFWWLGLPSPLMWGAIMAVLAVVPVLGTFVVWAPTAIYLAVQGDWGRALILAAWGGIAIALIDNLLYPFLVGKRLRFHTLLTFFAIVGGLTVFGASGLILGPLLLAFADALLDVWRRRTAFGNTADGTAT